MSRERHWLLPRHQVARDDLAALPSALRVGLHCYVVETDPAPRGDGDGPGPRYAIHLHRPPRAEGAPPAPWLDAVTLDRGRWRLLAETPRHYALTAVGENDPAPQPAAYLAHRAARAEGRARSQGFADAAAMREAYRGFSRD